MTFPGTQRQNHDSIRNFNYVRKNGDTDAGEVISLDGDDDIEAEIVSDDEEIRDSKKVPELIVYFDTEQRKHHKFINITEASDEEDIDVDIEEEDSDSDVEEIGVETETIEIPDDDDDEIVIPDVKANGIKSIPETNNTNTEASLQNKNGKGSICSKLTSKSPPEKSDSDCIILSPKNNPLTSTIPVKKLIIKPIQRRIENNSNIQKHPKSVLIGGVVKKVFSAHDIQSGVIPMRSILSKGITKNKSINVLSNMVGENRNQNPVQKVSLLKPLAVSNATDRRDTTSLLKPATARKSLLRPEITKDRRELQSILKSSQNRGDIIFNNQLKTPLVVKAVKCSQCGLVFKTEIELRKHKLHYHSPVQTADLPDTYSPAAILELERELKDQSKHCKKCYSGYWYLPTLRDHAKIHPSGQVGCDACSHAFPVIKGLINHLESHIAEIDSD